MSETRHTVRVNDGKYTFRTVYIDEAPGVIVEIDRHGEPWHRQIEALNALTSIMAELDAARVVIAAARAVSSVPRGDSRALVAFTEQIAAALERHEGLVGDHEPPSAWAAPIPRESASAPRASEGNRGETEE